MKLNKNPKPLPGDYALNDYELARQLVELGKERDEELKAAGIQFSPGDEIGLKFYRGELERIINALRGGGGGF